MLALLVCLTFGSGFAERCEAGFLGSFEMPLAASDELLL
jgi:hypothetical protein